MKFIHYIVFGIFCYSGFICAADESDDSNDSIQSEVDDEGEASTDDDSQDDSSTSEDESNPEDESQVSSPLEQDDQSDQAPKKKSEEKNAKNQKGIHDAKLKKLENELQKNIKAVNKAANDLGLEAKKDLKVKNPDSAKKQLHILRRKKAYVAKLVKAITKQEKAFNDKLTKNLKNAEAAPAEMKKAKNVLQKAARAKSQGQALLKKADVAIKKLQTISKKKKNEKGDNKKD